jgi:hypothetical protein
MRCGGIEPLRSAEKIVRIEIAALCGPTLRKPPASIQAIDPPPAEIDVMSSADTSIWRRAITPSVVSSGTPPWMKAISAEVPPMSSVTRPERASSSAK